MPISSLNTNMKEEGARMTNIETEKENKLFKANKAATIGENNLIEGKDTSGRRRTVDGEP